MVVISSVLDRDGELVFNADGFAEAVFVSLNLACIGISLVVSNSLEIGCGATLGIVSEEIEV